MIDLNSNGWLRALERALNVDNFILEISDASYQVTVFSVAFFRVAYLSFPVDIEISRSEVVDDFSKFLSDEKVDILYFNSYQKVNFKTRGKIIGQTSCLINDLSSWPDGKLKKPKRSANKLKKTKLKIRCADESDSSDIFQLYKDTVCQQGGSLRYTKEYFKEVSRLGVTVAEYEGEICGFLAGGFKGNKAFYLHGGSRAEFKNLYPSDILMCHFIDGAKIAGMKTLDFLPSPENQAGLISYKKQWGGEKKCLFTYILYVNPVKATLFVFLKALYQKVF